MVRSPRWSRWIRVTPIFEFSLFVPCLLVCSENRQRRFKHKNQILSVFIDWKLHWLFILKVGINSGIDNFRSLFIVKLHKINCYIPPYISIFVQHFVLEVYICTTHYHIIKHLCFVLSLLRENLSHVLKVFCGDEYLFILHIIKWQLLTFSPPI